MIRENQYIKEVDVDDVTSYYKVETFQFRSGLEWSSGWNVPIVHMAVSHPQCSDAYGYIREGATLGAHLKQRFHSVFTEIHLAYLVCRHQAVLCNKVKWERLRDSLKIALLIYIKMLANGT